MARSIIETTCNETVCDRDNFVVVAQPTHLFYDKNHSFSAHIYDPEKLINRVHSSWKYHFSPFGRFYLTGNAANTVVQKKKFFVSSAKACD